MIDKIIVYLWFFMLGYLRRDSHGQRGPAETGLSSKER